MTKERKILLFSIILLFVFLIFPSIVNAADTYTTTSTINDVTVNWSYTLNDSNQIIDLTCTNPSDLTGSITIPSSLDGKTVVTIGHDAFESATGITEVIIPDSVTEIKGNAFSNCSELVNVDLGNLQRIYPDVFENCPKLTTILIPKTLVSGTIFGGIFTGTTNLTSATFENGITKIPEGILQDCSGITSVIIPNSVTEIGAYAFAGTSISEITLPDSVVDLSYSVFENCPNLANVDLGNLQSISFDAFKDCPKLKTIFIPKTLVDGVRVIDTGIFTGTTNLTSATFENGITKIPAAILHDCSEITSITIPDSVTEIDCYAFAGTSISEITIPNSVTSISYSVFKDCKQLKKITILDNVTDMGFYTVEDSDSVFENHNEDLTIYCYEGSMAANYALKYGIKYVYLTKPADETPDDNDQTNDENNNNPNKTDDTNNVDTNNEITTGKNDPTVAPGKIPYAGFRIGLTIIIILSVAGCIVAYMKYNKFKNI